MNIYSLNTESTLTPTRFQAIRTVISSIPLPNHQSHVKLNRVTTVYRRRIQSVTDIDCQNVRSALQLLLFVFSHKLTTLIIIIIVAIPIVFNNIMMWCYYLQMWCSFVCIHIVPIIL